MATMYAQLLHAGPTGHLHCRDYVVLGMLVILGAIRVVYERVRA